MPPNKTWKSTEYQIAALLGGKRTPLSGSNSGHHTSSDVLGLPDRFYIEIKRRKAYTTFFTPYIEHLKRGRHFVIPGTNLIFFWLSPKGEFEKNPSSYLSPSNPNRTRAIKSLFEATQKLGLHEGRSIPILIFRGHSMKGFFVLLKRIDLKEFTELLNEAGLRREQLALEKQSSS
jgi:hypothetical protein